MKNEQSYQIISSSFSYLFRKRNKNMIINRTPFQISLFGGGTDYPFYYEKNNGSVLSTTINHYGYTSIRTLPPYFKYNYSFRYSISETCKHIDDIKHDIARECLRYLKHSSGIEMTYSGDIPASSGIASRSSFCVGFLHALYSLQGKMISKSKLAIEATRIERENVGDYIGSQEAVMAAFGGFNLIDFNADGSFQVTPITMALDRLRYLNDRLLFFYTGVPVMDSKVAIKEVMEEPSTIKNLSEIKMLVSEAVRNINSGTKCFDDIGRILHESWIIKKKIFQYMSNPILEDIYQKALKAGAIGGKLCGVGGSFFLFYVPIEKQNEVINALSNFLNVPFNIENSCSQIIFYMPNREYK